MKWKTRTGDFDYLGQMIKARYFSGLDWWFEGLKDIFEAINWIIILNIGEDLEEINLSDLLEYWIFRNK